MDISLLDFELPPGLIAQHPAPRRAGSRLLRLGRETGAVEHLLFSQLPSLLRPGDLLLLNDTRVFPARLFARRASGARVEVFLLAWPGEDGSAPCLLRPAARVRDGEELALPGGDALTVRKGGEGGEGGERFRAQAPPGVLRRAALKDGEVPLPPYIRRPRGGPVSGPGSEDRERYQTVFARETGAVAAPTAGLHFDEDILAALRGRGVETSTLTLHVGAGTFAPVRERDLSRHRMHQEAYSIPADTAAAVARARGEGRRVVAAGTTVVRALESAAGEDGTVRPGTGLTRLLILPGFPFRVVDALLTNFHLPRSTLLALVCAFAGRERVLAAYAEAVRERYRFFSYGDAMLIE